MNGASFTAPERCVTLLVQAYHILEDAQAHANAWDRAGLGRELDRVRWMLGDLAAQVSTPHTDPAVDVDSVADWDRSPFGSAVEVDR